MVTEKDWHAHSPIKIVEMGYLCLTLLFVSVGQIIYRLINDQLQVLTGRIKHTQTE